ncbi:MAG: ATP-binding protein [Proteobacteria bacterium]|nr:ATP-binding protein [Pseudomonadota bacterium]
MRDLQQMLAQTGTPYRDHVEYLEDQLAAMRLRLEVAVEIATTGSTTRAGETMALEVVIQARLDGSDASNVPIALVDRRFGLSPSERSILWALIAHDLCPASRSLIRQLNTEPGMDPTTDTLRRITFGPTPGYPSAWTDLVPAGTLRALQLIEASGPVDLPIHRQAWKVAPRILALVHGQGGIDPGVEHFVSAWSRRDPVATFEVSEHVVPQLEGVVGAGVVIAFGPAGSGRRSLLASMLQRQGRSVVVVSCAAIAKDAATAARELACLDRECRLLDASPIFVGLDALGASGEIVDRIGLLEDRFPALAATSNGPIARRWRRPPRNIEFASLTREQHVRLWQRALPAASVEDARALSTIYPLSPAVIASTGSMHADRPATIATVADSLRSLLDHQLGGLATRMTTMQTWDDVVLPSDQASAVVELLARIREQRTVFEQWGFAAKVGKGIGVAALLSGPPGTGKSMTAALLAKDLGVELYQVDISKVTSKWIGETEKNLGAIFDAAEAGHAMLLFDEADTIFGKRTDVKSSNDRHANQETNYLLQRIERFTGIVVLTTNYESAIDEAFRRRLAAHIRFPVPETDERLLLWRALIPTKAPTSGDLRLADLAEKFEMSGGYIRNAVVRAAFLAAAEGSAIHANHLRYAAHLEYEGMGKISTRS